MVHPQVPDLTQSVVLGCRWN